MQLVHDLSTIQLSRVMKRAGYIYEGGKGIHSVFEIQMGNTLLINRGGDHYTNEALGRSYGETV